jgi:uncharacterized surface protein with fasciclin (FAS1) repeats
MKNVITRSLHSMVLAVALVLMAPVAMAGSFFQPTTILDKLLQTDGAQAVVAAVLVVDEAEVLDFKLADVLDDPHAEVVLLAPSNAAFEKLLGLDAGTLNGLSIDDVKTALPGLLPAGVGASEVAAILLKHVSLPERPNKADLKTASDAELLANGSIEVADTSVFPVGVGASGVQVNYETTIIKANVDARNGVIHFIDTVIVDELL